MIAFTTILAALGVRAKSSREITRDDNPPPPQQERPMALKDIFAAIAAQEDRAAADATASVLNADQMVRQSMTGVTAFTGDDVLRLGAIVRSYLPRVATRPPAAANTQGQASAGEAGEQAVATAIAAE